MVITAHAGGKYLSLRLPRYIGLGAKGTAHYVLYVYAHLGWFGSLNGYRSPSPLADLQYFPEIIHIHDDSK